MQSTDSGSVTVRPEAIALYDENVHGDLPRPCVSTAARYDAAAATLAWQRTPNFFAN